MHVWAGQRSNHWTTQARAQLSFILRELCFIISVMNSFSKESTRWWKRSRRENQSSGSSPPVCGSWPAVGHAPRAAGETAQRPAAGGGWTGPRKEAEAPAQGGSAAQRCPKWWRRTYRTRSFRPRWWAARWASPTTRLSAGGNQPWDDWWATTWTVLHHLWRAASRHQGRPLLQLHPPQEANKGTHLFFKTTCNKISLLKMMLLKLHL